MEISAQILVYTAWLVVGIAAFGAIRLTLAKRDLGRDRAALSDLKNRVAGPVESNLATQLRLLRAKSQPMSPAEFQLRKKAGFRLSFFLMVPLLVLGYRWGGAEWGIVVVLCGLIYVPAFTLPFSLVHTYLLRLIGARGPVVSTVIGLLLGAIVAPFIRDLGFTKLAVGYGGVYGLITGLGSTSIAAPALVADSRPRTLEEQAKADGL